MFKLGECLIDYLRKACYTMISPKRALSAADTQITLPEMRYDLLDL